MDSNATSGGAPGIREATAAELADWDTRTVDRPGGHVYQSRAWAEYQATAGWRTRHMVFADGFGVLALERRWPLLPGGSAYLTRGPIPGGEPVEQTAERLRAVTAWLGARGVDVIASDAEVPAASAYPALLAQSGFHPIEEIQPSRHRMGLPLVGRDEAAVLAGVAKATRQRIRQAERTAAEVLRFDTRAGAAAIDARTADAGAAPAGLDAFYDLLLATGERRGFTFGARGEFVTWWQRAFAAGHLVYLAAVRPDDPDGRRPLAGLVLFRHGERLSTVHSADVANARTDVPGLPHLLRWRAIQLALAERRAEMDLGGVDVPGARRVPNPGEPMYGLYEHKRSFGAEWLTLAGAHERVLRPRRYRAGRVAARIRRSLPWGRQ